VLAWVGAIEAGEQIDELALARGPGGEQAAVDGDAGAAAVEVDVDPGLADRLRARAEIGVAYDLEGEGEDDVAAIFLDARLADREVELSDAGGEQGA
jgi:hypothetical protein